jgi:rare lipoprotein A
MSRTWTMPARRVLLLGLAAAILSPVSAIADTIGAADTVEVAAASTPIAPAAAPRDRVTRLDVPIPARSARWARTASAPQLPAPIVMPAASVDARSSWQGVASWYGPGFAGRLTANGEVFDPNQLTAAHRTLPFGSQVRVINPATGLAVVVTINDRGPFIPGREIDLSWAAAEVIGLVSAGTGVVILELL